MEVDLRGYCMTKMLRIIKKLVISYFFVFFPCNFTSGMLLEKKELEGIDVSSIDCDIIDNIDDSSDCCETLLREMMSNKSKEILSKQRANNSKLTVTLSANKSNNGHSTVFSKIVNNIPRDPKSSIKLMLTLGNNVSSLERIDEGFGLGVPGSKDNNQTTPKTNCTSVCSLEKRIRVLNKIKKCINKCKCENALRFPHTVSIRRIYLLLKLLSKMDVTVDELDENIVRKLNSTTLIKKSSNYKHSNSVEKVKLGDFLNLLWNSGETSESYNDTLDNFEIYSIENSIN